MKFFLTLLSTLCTLTLLAQEITYDRTIKQYIVAEFIPLDADLTPEQGQTIQRAHLAYIQSLAQNKQLVLAGPFMGGGGLFFLNTNDEQEAKKWMEQDPTIQNKVNRFTLRKWLTEKGLFTLENAVTKKSAETVAVNSLDVQQFIADSIWFRTYRHFYQGLITPQIQECFKHLAEREKVPLQFLGLFSMLVQNFDCTNLKVRDLQQRYPFMNPSSIQQQFSELVTLNLLDKNVHQYSLTQKGILLTQLISKQLEGIEVKVNDSALDLLEKIVDDLPVSNPMNVPSSLQKRRRATLRFTDTPRPFLRLMTVMDDLVALRNDYAHYRYQLYKQEFSELGLSHPAAEILSTAVSKGAFKPDQFQKRPTWGYDATETESFIRALLKQQLLEKRSAIYYPTEKGRKMEHSLSDQMEQLFYIPWENMSRETYQFLLQTISS